MNHRIILKLIIPSNENSYNSYYAKCTQTGILKSKAQDSIQSKPYSKDAVPISN